MPGIMPSPGDKMKSQTNMELALMKLSLLITLQAFPYAMENIFVIIKVSLALPNCMKTFS